MKNRQLKLNIRAACAAHLPEWRKHRTYALYRRTEDFVQWLIFDISRFDILVVPHYAVQALAEEDPAEALTLGQRVHDSQGTDLWIRPDEWVKNESYLVNQIISQIAPPALEPLTVDAVIKFLNSFGFDHVAAITARGIASIIAGSIDEGQHYLEAAAKWYGSMNPEWAKKKEEHIRTWLACSPDALIKVLRQDAEEGVRTLGLQ